MLQMLLKYLGHELVGDRLVVLEADLSGGERPLQEETQRQLGELGLDQGADGLMGKREDLLALFLPLIVLQVGEEKEKKTKTRRLIQCSDESLKWVCSSLRAWREKRHAVMRTELKIKKKNLFRMVL